MPHLKFEGYITLLFDVVKPRDITPESTVVTKLSLKRFPILEIDDIKTSIADVYVSMMRSYPLIWCLDDIS